MTLLRVYSEIGPLRRVLLRRPSFEQQLLTPNKMKKYLFDDILHLSTAQREHDVFTSCLRRLGVEVICFDDLLLIGLQNGGAASIFQARIGQKMGRKAIDALMANLSNQVEALRFIIDGVHEKVPPTLNLTPLLNTIFTRDLGFVAGESFISVNASRNVRKGEVRLLRAILSNHPGFKDESLIVPAYGRHVIEGGDIQVLSPKVVCIGISQRTSESGAQVVVKLLQSLSFDIVITVKMYKNRSCMHLDTIMTMIDQGFFLVYKPMILDQGNKYFCKATIYRQGEKKVSLLSAGSRKHCRCAVSILITYFAAETKK